MLWTDVNDIAIELDEQHPDVDQHQGAVRQVQLLYRLRQSTALVILRNHINGIFWKFYF